MDSSTTNFDGVSSLAIANRSGTRSTARRYRLPFSASSLIQAPLSALLEYSGILLPESSHVENESLIGEGFASLAREPMDASVSGTGNDVSIRIIGIEDPENDRPGAGIPLQGSAGTRRAVDMRNSCDSTDEIWTSSDMQGGVALRDSGGAGLFSTAEGSTISSSTSRVGLESENGEGNASAVNLRDSTHQRYDIQQAVRWIEPVLPFSLLLLVVFVRTHLQGFFVTIWLAAVLFKSNDILRKQTALKGERKISILVGVTLILILHIVGVYWWYRKGDLFYPWVMLPPKDIPPFWQAIFIILVNDTIVRQVAMVIKCILLMHYKNTRGRNYCKQGQLLTLVEYLVLLYRALLPTPVWYRFFLNKEYGSLFSSLTTGLYLTFKLTSVVGKVQSFLGAVKAISWKEVHYGSHASAEQNGAISICHKGMMHGPVILGCKHIFCEECSSLWFERERTCPICHGLDKPEALVKSFADGSTALSFQFF